MKIHLTDHGKERLLRDAERASIRQVARELGCTHSWLVRIWNGHSVGPHIAGLIGKKFPDDEKILAYTAEGRATNDL